ncbi:Secreted effector protein pipB2 [Gemmata sp. SH-PL17]|uniref:pentapeptide repeat-containing protein n=1 Tax=Gemmata sp. SH-PL17 TaxID=1630693 RepID=UPI00078EE592|nr:pentapeptide repeat-containing protein [Gemmata sp. SH-PL17]AMV28772.1 Secreted effector protein pipB2 [Gemmata sp. SH-PL17]
MAKKKPATKTAPATKKPTAKKSVAKKPAPKADVNWVEVLKSGAAGVKKWNKLTVAERKAVKLTSADLCGADLAEINFRGLSATKLKAAGAKLVGANGVGASFLAGDFHGADLTDANLRGFNGRDADFSAAKLVGTDLWEGRFLRAKFVKADLTRANLLETDLTGADFTDAVLTDANLSGASFDQTTKWPAGFVIPGEARWQGKGTDPRLVGKGKKAAAQDINGLMARLHTNIDEKRMKRTLDMLKKERNQIFSEIEPTMVRGIVRSQRDIDTVYSCVLTDDGTYSCGTVDMEQCMGLSNEPCKHLLVLLIGLARAGQLDPATADKWVVAANKKGPRWNKTVQSHIADSFLKYKGVQAGEIDWRPTETIPEDFYAM